VVSSLAVSALVGTTVRRIIPFHKNYSFLGSAFDSAGDNRL
jgi:hypothetical protein